MTKDTIYKKPIPKVPPFEFNQEVAAVFDDMLQRSVPCYREIIYRQAQLVERFYQPGTRVYDLGCSNGNLGVSLCKTMGKPFEMVAVDNSEPMLAVYRERLAALPGAPAIRLCCDDITAVNLSGASVVILNLTLQFLPMDSRLQLLKKICQSLVPGGIFLFTEKIIHPDHAFSELQKDFYHAFKRENGYCDLEISQKREALENVLIPEPLELHLKRLHTVGFQTIDVWLKWFNFCSMLCQKEPR